MFRLIKKDLEAKSVWYYGSADTKKILRMLVTDGTWAAILYRAQQFLMKIHLVPLALVVARINEFFHHITIGRSADFGPGLVLAHTFGVVINSDVRGGSNIIIEHGVTIGAEKKKSPVLGDNIFIGAGAKVIGEVRIGSNVKIGANAVVVKDVPDGVTVAGVPAKVVGHGGRS